MSDDMMIYILGGLAFLVVAGLGFAFSGEGGRFGDSFLDPRDPGASSKGPESTSSFFRLPNML